MNKDTGALYLDQRQAMGIDFGGSERGYPDLDDHERRVLDVVASGLFISKSSIQWAYHDALRGDKNAFRSVLKILSGGPLRGLKK